MIENQSELREALASLALWLDGMSKFISITKAQWPHASTAQLLLAQKLTQHTLKMRDKINALAERIPHGG